MLKLNNLQKNFGGITAVNDVSFKINEGEIVGLIGPNGAGKTTLFNVISGFIEPTSGSVYFENVDITDKKPHEVFKQGLIRTFQDSRIYENLTVYENMIASSPIESKINLFRQMISEESTSQAESLLSITDMDDLRYNYGHELSFGQKKLTEFATLFMGNPSLALLDEPCGGVNPSIIEIFKQHISNLNDEGKTFLIIEHNMDFAMEVCDRIIVLDKGTILSQGTPSEIQEDEEVLAAYLGDPDHE